MVNSLPARLCLALALLALTVRSTVAQTSPAAEPWSIRMANAFMQRFPDSIAVKENKPAGWDYEQGLMLKALERVWDRTADARYYNYILHDIDRYVADKGPIRTYRMDDYNLDNVTTGRALLMLAQQTQPGREKYKRAADTLRMQLARQPRTKAGGFWHKLRYPNQMWLDGLYMAEPFYAEYTALYDRNADSATRHFDDVARQFALIEKNLIDPKTGLLYHGYDESRQQKWANPKTGTSPNFWGRSVGWYAMALVDVLDYLPAANPHRAELIGYLQRLMPVLLRYQDPKTGVWYQMLDQGTRAGNYVEASASAMFVYALAKGVRMGYLPAPMLAAARRGYAGMLKSFIETDAKTGLPSLNGTVSVGGLGGNPYRDGSYEYYLSEPIRLNDLKGVGPFILASVELEIADENAVGQGKTVAVDTYFNHEFRKGDGGAMEPFHYTWEDRMHSGFWLWGNTFRELGAKTISQPAAPSASALRGIDVLIIVDPDTRKETTSPHYMSDADADALVAWVRAGGVLALMANDSANADLPHTNKLAGRFGVQFGDEQVNPVKGTEWAGGKLTIPANHPQLGNAGTIYIKELAPLTVKAPATPVLRKGDTVIMATAKVGKGTVFVVGDPWLYNEYVDGRRIPAEYRNFQAGKSLAMWLLQQVPARRR
ncbi:hypothetical protein GCM10027578_26450 [Spirosoma luteolum]